MLSSRRGPTHPVRGTTDRQHYGDHPHEDHSSNEVSDGDVPRQSDWQTRRLGFNGSNIDIESGIGNNRFANGIATARNSSVPNICTCPGRATASTPQSSDSGLQDDIMREMAHA